MLSAINRAGFWKRSIRVHNNRIEVRSLDRTIYAILHRFGVMGTEERKFFAEHIRPGMTVVDIGMNIGMYSLMFADLVGSGGKVYSFEPDPVLFDIAQTNIRTNGKGGIVTAHNTALGSAPKEAKLHRGAFNWGDNRLSGDTGDENAVAVRIGRLDDFVGDARIDWIKIDVQGWEFEVLRGMGGVLEKNPAARIFLEFWPTGLRNAGESPLEFLAALVSMGYQIYHPEDLSHALTKAEMAPLEKLPKWIDLVAFRPTGL